LPQGYAGFIDRIDFTGCGEETLRLATAGPDEVASLIPIRPTYRTG